MHQLVRKRCKERSGCTSCGEQSRLYSVQWTDSLALVGLSRNAKNGKPPAVLVVCGSDWYAGTPAAGTWLLLQLSWNLVHYVALALTARMLHAILALQVQFWCCAAGVVMPLTAQQDVKWGMQLQPVCCTAHQCFTVVMHIPACSPIGLYQQQCGGALICLGDLDMLSSGSE